MLRFFLAFFVSIICGPATAEWRTTKALPIPLERQNPTDYINDFALDNFSRQDLYQDAGAPLRYVMGLFSFDAKKLADAGFPGPRIGWYLEDEADSYIPIFWTMGDRPRLSEDAEASYSCAPVFPVIEVHARSSQSLVSYDFQKRAWDGGGGYRSGATARLSSYLIHELVHAIQSNTDGDWLCSVQPPNWAAESQANGVAHYLLSKRDKTALRRFAWARDVRDYSESLVERNLEYQSGSFVRYLIEATEINGISDLSLARDLVTEISASEAADDFLVLSAYNRIVRRHSGRPLAIVFAEFLTELASYSERYRVDSDGWVASSFGNCIRYTMTPGMVETQSIAIFPNSGRCIRVSWSGFDAATSIQFMIDSPMVDLGTLHLGESYRERNLSSGAVVLKYCYAVTSKINNRISNETEQKCMLRRGAKTAGASLGALASFNGWTTDFNVRGEGHAIFILTNAATDMADTAGITFDLQVGTNSVTDETGASLKPKRETDQPVREGRTLMDSRVHAIAGGPGRLLFDGRSIFGDGIDLGFLEGAPGADEIDGGGAIVRAGDYMIMLIKDKQGVPDAAMIVRDPETSGGRSITTLGTEGLGDIPSCGYAVPATIDFLTTADDVLRFKVSGDLFDLSPATMMAAGQGGICDALRAAHVEYKSIEVSLPFPELYDGKVEITRAYPPMQDIYDELEFRSGPSFGGIDTSRSLVLGDGVVGDESAGEAGDTGNSTAGGSSSTVQCTCHCPNIVSPTSGACFDQCEPVFQMCPDPNSTDALNADASRYSEILQGQGLADAVREMLLSDFSAMSGDTRSQIIREALWN